MGINSYTLADGTTATVNATDNGVEFNEGMDAITKAVNSKLNSLNPIYGEATSLESGLMSATDKAKLDAIDTSQFVLKDGDKVLSDKNFTATEKNKLASLPSAIGTGLTMSNGTLNCDVKGIGGLTLDISGQDASAEDAGGNAGSILASGGWGYEDGPGGLGGYIDLAGGDCYRNGGGDGGTINLNGGDAREYSQYDRYSGGNGGVISLCGGNTMHRDSSTVQTGHGGIIDMSPDGSIKGNVVFTGTPTFKNGANGLSVSGDTTYDFDKKVTLESGFTTASSISSNFGVYNTINIKDNSTVKAENCYINLSSGELVLTGSEIRANNANIAGIPTFTSGFKTADSVNSNFGDDNHVNLGHRSKLALASDSTIDADHSYIDLSHGEIRFNYSKLTFSSSGNESITGNPIFTGTPTFLHGASGLSASGGISYSDATTTTSGLMSKEDKAKLDAIDTSKYVLKDGDKVLSDKNFTATEKNKLASLTISPTFTGIPRFEKGLKLGSGSDALKSMTINDGKLQIAIGSKTYTFTPDSSASTQNNLLTPTITFNPAQMDTIKGVKPYSFSYTINSDATYHSYYLTDSRYPNWRYPDDHDIIFSDDYALSNTINNVTILDAEAETTSGTITYYITVPATDNYSEKTFTYSINYTNC